VGQLDLTAESRIGHATLVTRTDRDYLPTQGIATAEGPRNGTSWHSCRVYRTGTHVSQRRQLEDFGQANGEEVCR
jgi:hypothetical protein